MSAQLKKWLVHGVGAGIFAAVLWFFVREFHKNLDALEHTEFHFHYLLLFLAFASTLAAYALITRAWAYTLNVMSPNRALTFVETLPVMNIPSLAKYLPGKVWTFAIQARWLGNAGYAPALVLFNGLLSIFVSLLISAVIGVVFLLYHPEVIALAVTAWLALALALLEVAMLGYGKTIMQVVFHAASRILKRELVPFPISAWPLLVLQAIFVVVFFLFGIGATLLAAGLGFQVGADGFVSILASGAVADAIGYLVIFVPGGFGVREGVMYVLMKGLPNESLRLMLPFATRLVMMMSEVTLGVAGLVVLRRARAVKSEAA